MEKYKTKLFGEIEIDIDEASDNADIFVPPTLNLPF